MPDNVLGEAWIAVRALVEKFDEDLRRGTEGPLEEAGKEAGESYGGAFDKEVKAKLTAVSAAVATFATLTAKSYEEGSFTIRRETGATGDALAALEGSMRSVASQTKTSISEIGAVISQLASRTELAAQPMEALAKQVVQLAEITGGDASDTVTQAIDLFKKWQVETARQAATLDLIFVASQKAGVPVANLIDAAVSGASAFKNLGFSLEQTVGILTNIEREGGDANKVVAAMVIAFNKLAAAGHDPVPAFADLSKEIKNAGSTAEATRIAVDALGTRAGPLLAAQIRAGRFEVEHLIAALGESAGAIAKTREETTSLGDRFANLRNRVVSLIGPVSQQVAAFATIAAGTGPFISGLRLLSNAYKGVAIAAALANVSVSALTFGAIASALKGVALAAAAAAPEIIAVTAAVAAGVVIYKSLAAATEEHGKSVDASSKLLAAYAINVEKGNHTLADFQRVTKALANEEGLSADEKARLVSEAKELQAAIEGNTRVTDVDSAAVKELAQAERDQARAVKERILANLQLAGGFLGIQAAALSAKNAQRQLSDAEDLVAKLADRGKKGTDKYRDAISDLRQKTVDAVEGQLGLASAVVEYLKDRGDLENGQARVNALVKEYGDRANLTHGQIDDLRDTVRGLIDDYRKVPSEVNTHVRAPGLDELLDKAKTLSDLLDTLTGKVGVPGVLANELVNPPDGGGGRHRGGGKGGGGGGGGGGSGSGDKGVDVSVSIDGVVVQQSRRNDEILLDKFVGGG